jgi:hypothetical protein
MVNRKLAILTGLLFWVSAAGIIVYAALTPSPRVNAPTAGPGEPGELNEPTVPLANQLVGFWLTPRRTIALALPEVPAKDGDPIFARLANGEYVQAGYLINTDSDASASLATAVWHAGELEPGDYEFQYQRNRGKIGDIVKLLLPPEKRQRVEHIIRESIERDGQVIAEAMRPLVNRSMRESLPTIEKAFRASIANHRIELEAIGETYRETLLEERLMPLLKDEVLPIVKKHGEPLAQQIGRELWDRASVWRFGWRFLYDRTPLPERELVKREWDRFVEEEAVPVLESHTADMLAAQKNIINEISRNQRVRDELSEIASEIAKDRELQRVVAAILREAIVENMELRRVWIEIWRSAEAKAALQLAGDRLEPVVREIGDELFGTREEGISPSFARVLRNQILGKDKRWILAVPRDRSPGESMAENDGPYRVGLATDDLPFPMLLMAAPEPTLEQ